MRITESTPAVLLLQDGTLFHGKALGKIGTHGGEICFNTGMTGYQEIYTDPSYAGQVIINTTAHIGNYGVISEGEAESDQVQIAGMVCNEFASVHSRATSDGSLQDYLVNAGIVGISGIDTRALVRHIRTKGVMNCLISSEIFDLDALTIELSKIPSMEGLELSSQVCTQESYFLGDETSEVERQPKINILNQSIINNKRVELFRMFYNLDKNSNCYQHFNLTDFDYNLIRPFYLKYIDVMKLRMPKLYDSGVTV